MATLTWNVRGLGNKDTVRALKNLIQKYQLDIIFLSETKQQKRYLEKIRMKMKMIHSFYVEPNGVAGGSWDENKLTNLFSREEVKAILTIPIGGPTIKDSIVWVASKDGGYSV
ncbi:hypothetical protein GQ457_01G027200 [Hibiscus cannabinus]